MAKAGGRSGGLAPACRGRQEISRRGLWLGKV